jgi:HEAT repeat protein
MGADAQAAIPALIEALTDPHAFVRRAAAYALGEIGRVAKDAVIPALTKALDDPEPYVRETASAVLRRIHSARRTRNVAELACDGDCCTPASRQRSIARDRRQHVGVGSAGRPLSAQVDEKNA